MMAPKIEEMFNLRRVSGHPLALLLLIVYAPFGLTLLVVRVFISLQLFMAVALLPKRTTITRLVTRCICMVLGLFVRQENLHNNPLYEDYCAQAGGKRRLIVMCNHVSTLDHLAISTVMPCVKLSCNGENIPDGLTSMVGCWLLETRRPAKKCGLSPRDDVDILTRVRKFLDLNVKGQFGDLPLLVFPEETTTNGVAGVMKYQNWPLACALNDNEEFSKYIEKQKNPQNENITQTATEESSQSAIEKSLNSQGKIKENDSDKENGANSVTNQENEDLNDKPMKIGPLLLISLKVRRFPPLPLQTSTLENSSSVFLDLFTLLLCPFTIYTVRYFGIVRPSPSDTLGSLSTRLQHTTASMLGVQPTVYTSVDKGEYSKRASLPPPPPPHLLQQVRQVLPHVPIEPIARDLARTRNADQTIANLLENRVPGFDPNSPQAMEALTQPPLNPTGAGGGPNLCTSLSDFSLDPSHRMTSFQQRKLLLIQNARHNYVSKYGVGGERDPYLSK